MVRRRSCAVSNMRPQCGPSSRRGKRTSSGWRVCSLKSSHDTHRHLSFDHARPDAQRRAELRDVRRRRLGASRAAERCSSRQDFLHVPSARFVAAFAERHIGGLRIGTRWWPVQSGVGLPIPHTAISREPAPHRDSSANHRGACSGKRPRRSQAAAGRFRLVRRRTGCATATQRAISRACVGRCPRVPATKPRPDDLITRRLSTQLRRSTGGRWPPARCALLSSRDGTRDARRSPAHRPRRTQKDTGRDPREDPRRIADAVEGFIDANSW